MRKLADHLGLVAVTLWVGGLWAIGYVVAPTLFASLENKILAGMLAGKLFTIIAYVGLVCGSYLLLLRLSRFGFGAFRQSAFWLVLAMLLLTVAGHFGIQPVIETLKAQAFPKEVMRSVVRDRFATWHGIASGLYLVQSLLGLGLVLKQGK